MATDNELRDITELVGTDFLNFEIEEIESNLIDKIKKYNHKFWRKRREYPGDGEYYSFNITDLNQINLDGSTEDREKSIFDYINLRQAEYGINQEQKKDLFGKIREKGICESPIEVRSELIEFIENWEQNIGAAITSELKNKLKPEKPIEKLEITLTDLDHYINQECNQTLYKFKNRDKDYSLGLVRIKNISEKELGVQIYRNNTEVYNKSSTPNKILEDEEVKNFFKK